MTECTVRREHLCESEDCAWNVDNRAHHAIIKDLEAKLDRVRALADWLKTRTDGRGYILASPDEIARRLWECLGEKA